MLVSPVTFRPLPSYLYRITKTHNPELCSPRRLSAIADIQRAKQLALDNEIDLLLSIGGGSPIDSTKAISHFVREAKGGKGAFLPHLAVPTTLSVAETTQ